MNTKIIMVTSAIGYGLIGATLLFVPLEVLVYLDLETSILIKVLLQLLGAFYFSFAFLNWMTKQSRIGGIYNRPIAIANFSHLLIAGLTLIKVLCQNLDLPTGIWVFTILYAVYAIAFGILLFNDPVK